MNTEREKSVLLEPHHRYCLCDECIESIRLVREYHEPWSWPKFIGWIAFVNFFCWLIFG